MTSLKVTNLTTRCSNVASGKIIKVRSPGFHAWTCDVRRWLLPMQMHAVTWGWREIVLFWDPLDIFRLALLESVWISHFHVDHKSPDFGVAACGQCHGYNGCGQVTWDSMAWTASLREPLEARFTWQVRAFRLNLSFSFFLFLLSLSFFFLFLSLENVSLSCSQPFKFWVETQIKSRSSPNLPKIG